MIFFIIKITKFETIIMKKGVVVIFKKEDIDYVKHVSLKSFLKNKITLCLVNNGNDGEVLIFLDKLKYESNCDVSILNLRKEKTATLAVKAGVRFLHKKEDMNLIVHAQPENIFNKNVIKKILNITEENLIHKIEKRVLLRRVYALNELINC